MRFLWSSYSLQLIIWYLFLFFSKRMSIIMLNEMIFLLMHVILMIKSKMQRNTFVCFSFVWFYTYVLCNLGVHSFLYFLMMKYISYTYSIPNLPFVQIFFIPGIRFKIRSIFGNFLLFLTPDHRKAIWWVILLFNPLIFTALLSGQYFRQLKKFNSAK